MKPKIVHLDFCTIELYPNYMVCIINKGATISIDESNEIAVVGDGHFKGKEFVYLTYRKHSYSVDPGIYKYTSMVDNLLGFGVVSNNKLSIESAKVEKTFLSKPFKIFDNMEDAAVWANHLINKA